MKKLVLCGFAILFATLWAGCAKDANPLPSKSHPKDWTISSAPDFHGKKVIEAGKVSCTGCHGYDLDGGEAQIACHSCHTLYPHDAGWMVMSAAPFHGTYIAGQNWSMKSCQKCHGVNYSGGSSKKSCLACHSDEGGPEACNTCHGSRKNAAPPEDLSGHISQTALGVGAHQRHMDANIACSKCHLVPETVQDSGHIDSTPHAEVTAALQWNRTTATCITSCHSNTGKTYIWNSN
jgi:hypothetical protein